MTSCLLSPSWMGLESARADVWSAAPRACPPPSPAQREGTPAQARTYGEQRQEKDEPKAQLRTYGEQHQRQKDEPGAQLPCHDDRDDKTGHVPALGGRDALGGEDQAPGEQQTMPDVRTSLVAIAPVDVSSPRRRRLVRLIVGRINVARIARPPSPTDVRNPSHEGRCLAADSRSARSTSS